MAQQVEAAEAAGTGASAAAGGGESVPEGFSAEFLAELPEEIREEVFVSISGLLQLFIMANLDFE